MDSQRPGRWIDSGATPGSAVSLFLCVSEDDFILSVIHEMKVCQAM